MPVITVTNAGTLEKETKAELIRRLTDTVSEVTGKDPKYVYVKIEEVPRENFGVGGKQLG